MPEKKNSTYNRIIRIAGDMIRRDGYEKVTVAQIVKEAGISLGTFYHYFPSKKSVLDGVRKIDSYFDTTVRSLLRHQSLPEDVSIFWSKYTDYIENDGLKVVWSIYQNYQAKLLISEQSVPFQMLLGVFEEGVVRKELRDDCDRKALVARMFMCAHGATMQWTIRDGNLDVRKEIADLTGTLLHAHMTPESQRKFDMSGGTA